MDVNTARDKDLCFVLPIIKYEQPFTQRDIITEGYQSTSSIAAQGEYLPEGYENITDESDEEDSGELKCLCLFDMRKYLKPNATFWI